MIKPEDLRIGNYVTINNPQSWIQLKDVPLCVTAIEIRHEFDFPESDSIIRLINLESVPYSQTYSQFNEFIDPILLTPELLLKIGSKEMIDKNGNRGVWKNKSGIWLADISTGGFCVVQARTDIIVRYLHQYQNITYALSGKELIVNL